MLRSKVGHEIFIFCLQLLYLYDIILIEKKVIYF